MRKTIAGAISIANRTSDNKSFADMCAVGNTASEACLHVVDKSHKEKFVSIASLVPDKLSSGVGPKFSSASDLRDNEFNKVIFEDFLPKANTSRLWIRKWPERFLSTSKLVLTFRRRACLLRR